MINYLNKVVIILSQLNARLKTDLFYLEDFMSFLKVIFITLVACVSQQVQAADIEILFTYGSEKENWIKEVTEQFNAAHHKINDGKVIKVIHKPMGSGDLINSALNGEVQAHIVSPASDFYMTLGNAESVEKTGKNLTNTQRQDLVRSPVIIAMWKPMAEALGWGKKPIGWEEILNMVGEPEGWKKYGHPEWGNFKFGHTHPKYSNSGLTSLITEVYAGARKVKDLTIADVSSPDVRNYVQSIENGVVHYGESTGFFGKKMFKWGANFLSAAVLYENMVIESYSSKEKLEFPVVAIYPKEGTFWTNHPVSVIERDWVKPEHREAAKKYIDYLLDRPQQEKAVKYGFRPVDQNISLSATFNQEHGVDLNQPTTLLEVPQAAVMKEILGLWEERKKHGDVVLAVDISGSMKGDKLVKAKEGALKFLGEMSDEDSFSLVIFNNEVSWLIKQKPLRECRQEAEKKIQNLFAGGNTALYDSALQSYQLLKNNPQKNRISAVVILSDGEDTSTKPNSPEAEAKLKNLLSTIALREEAPILFFPIGYGKDAKQDILKLIADETKTKAFSGETDNIKKVFLEISTFF
jgi:Ca-activated chloride channel family protein